MKKSTGRASGAEQRCDSHRAGSHSAGRPNECDDEGRYIDPSVLQTRSGSEAFSVGNGTSADDNLLDFGTPTSGEPAPSYYNPGYREVAGSSLDGGVLPHSYVTSVFGELSSTYYPFSTEECFPYYSQSQQTAPVYSEGA